MDCNSYIMYLFEKLLKYVHGYIISRPPNYELDP
jgi:hypothetical protein